MAIQNLKQEVFEIMSKGGFICSNSIDTRIQKLYNYVEEEFDALHDYFSEINFILERGNEYFYFSRPESKADIRRKLDTAFKWIDIVDFFKSYNNSFSSGYRFTPHEIVVKLKVDVQLKNKLAGLNKYTKTQNEHEAIKKLTEMLTKEGFCELENEINDSYKVLASFTYLEELILNINISEEKENEIPE
ncbi:MAG: condensin complex protein MksE [Marinilabiliaceae bacterium]